jgi:ribosome-associated protein
MNPSDIPVNRLTVRFTRSGGPGGQNVNKVATRVEMRFVVDEADWIPAATRERFKTQQRRRINGEGEMVLFSSRYRVQHRNLEDCLEKLARWINLAAEVPKPRRPTRPTTSSRRKRVERKKQRGQLKQNRRKPTIDD